MLPRFSYLSRIPYDQHILASQILSATQGLASGPVKEIIQSNLYGQLISAQATIRSGQEITSAVQDSGQETVAAIDNSTQSLSGEMHKAILANLFGSLMLSGTVAVSTALMLKRIDKINVGIERLGAQYTEGMSLLASKLDVQTNALSEIRDQLGRIHETLKSPTITQATEHRNLALQRIGQGLWPEAEKSFIKAIDLDETDPISHLMLGKIYLDAVDDEVNLHDPEKAQKHFSSARRYASMTKSGASKLVEIEEESSYLLSVALFAHASKILATSGQVQARSTLEQSLKATDLLLQQFPSHLQGMYLRLKLLVILEHEVDACKQFEQLLHLDQQFLAVALNDEDFRELNCTPRTGHGLQEELS